MRPLVPAAQGAGRSVLDSEDRSMLILISRARIAPAAREGIQAAEM